MSYKKFDQADLEVIKNMMKEFYMQKISTKNTVMMN